MALDLSEKQLKGLKMLQDPDKGYILFTGGARSGKTFLIVEFMVGRAFQFPGSRQLVVRKTRISAKESLWDDSFTKYLSTHIPSSEYEMLKSELVIKFSNGSTIMIAGLDDAARADKILGTEYITIFCNEATQLEYDVIGTLKTRLAQRVYDVDGKFVAANKMVLDCNPRQPTHWLYIWGILLKDPSTKPYKPLIDAERHATLHWTPEDNIKNLPPNFIEEHLDTLPHEARERMRFGRWCGSEGAIFKEFNDKIHMIEPFELPRYWPRIRAIDFGFDHPMAFLHAAYDFNTDTLYIYYEFKESGLTIDKLADKLDSVEKELNEFYEVQWADHSKTDRAFLANRGIITRPAKKSVTDGINAVRERLVVDSTLGRPKLLIFNTCDGLRDEMYAYTWHEDRSQVADSDKPVKLDDDLVDCLRYICYGQAKQNPIF